MTARFPVGAVPDANELMIKLYPRLRHQCGGGDGIDA